MLAAPRALPIAPVDALAKASGSTSPLRKRGTVRTSEGKSCQPWNAVAQMRGLAATMALPIRLEEVPCADLDTLEFDCLETTPFRDVRRLAPGCSLLLRRPEDLARPIPRAEFAKRLAPLVHSSAPTDAWAPLPAPGALE